MAEFELTKFVECVVTDAEFAVTDAVAAVLELFPHQWFFKKSRAAERSGIIIFSYT